MLKNEIKMEGSFVFRTKMEVPPAPPKLGPAASTYVVLISATRCACSPHAQTSQVIPAFPENG